MKDKDIIKLAQIALNRLYGANIVEDGVWGLKSQESYEKYYLKKSTGSIIKIENLKNKIQSIVNIFETGSPQGDYANVSIYSDGPNDIKQITFGRSQTTEFSNLQQLVKMYSEAEGLYSDQFKKYVERVGSKPSLAADQTFVDLLKKSGEDNVMKRVQDKFFDLVYWDKANTFWNKNGFKENLSLLIIYDSFIQGGLNIVRKKFAEKTPIDGGIEKKWIEAYTNARYDWLKYHSRTILRKTAKRPAFFKTLINSQKWDLSSPINLEGFKL